MRSALILAVPVADCFEARKLRCGEHRQSLARCHAGKMEFEKGRTCGGEQAKNAAVMKVDK